LRPPAVGEGFGHRTPMQFATLSNPPGVVFVENGGGPGVRLRK
jgi:hypothetical protein